MIIGNTVLLVKKEVNMKKILCLIFSVVMMVSFLTVKVNAETHTHCDCGESECSGTGHDSTKEWTSVSSLPTDSGYYCLANDIELGSTPWTIAAGKDIHLCLNGYEIKASSYLDPYMIVVGGTLTVTDCQETCGKITSINANGIFKVSGGTLNIYNGTVTHKKQDRHIILAENGGKVNVFDGTFANEKHETKDLTNIYGFLVAQSAGSEINVYGGDFTVNEITNNNSTKFAPYLMNTDGNGTFNITGGTFTAKYYGNSKHSFGTATITGGTFATASLPTKTGDVVDLSKKTAEGYELVDLGEGGPYQVKKIEAFKIGATTFSTLNEAIAAANENDNIVVLRDSDLKDVADISKKISIDLNGYVLSGTGSTSQIFKIVENGKLTIDDSSVAKTGKISAYNTSPTLIKIDSGELVVNGGNFTVQVDSYVSYSHVINCLQGKTTLNGGNFSVLKGCDTQNDNLFSSVVAATRKDALKDSTITINGGTYNCSYSETGTGKFASRIFTPYKGDNGDFGTINVNGGNFNGDYNNPELTEIKKYLNIVGGSFDRNIFTDNLKLSDMINTDKYYVKTSGERYVVTEVEKTYSVVNTCTK